MRISMFDSGAFADDTGRRSNPRIASVIHDAILNNRGVVSAISYVKSPKGDCLPGESNVLRDIRANDRWTIEESRVCETARSTFQVQPTDIESNLATESALVVIVMRPSKARSKLVERAVEAGKRWVIIFPPYFSSVSELDNLRKVLSASENRVVLWLPYRYSAAIKAIKEHFRYDEIAAIELSIACAPYLHRLLIHEWSLPFLDAGLRVIGGEFENIEISRTLSTLGSPIFHLKSMHRNDSSNYVLASSLISTAGATLQNIEAARLKVFASTKMESIESTGTFTGYVHRTPRLHSFTDLSHDSNNATLTGYGDLLQRCLEKRFEDDDVKPTLANFSQMQRVLDLFQALQEKAGLINAPITEGITF